MPGFFNRNKVSLASLAGGAIAMVAVGTASYANSLDKQVQDARPGEPFCEVTAQTTDNAVTIEALFHAHVAVQGSYMLSVRSSGGAGSTNINQGGGFATKGVETITLGTATVGGSPAYDVELVVDTDGQTHTCGGRLE